jgi:hypothetical protein
MKKIYRILPILIVDLGSCVDPITKDARRVADILCRAEKITDGTETQMQSLSKGLELASEAVILIDELREKYNDAESFRQLQTEIEKEVEKCK